jgi:hypothetical protein
MAEKPRLRTVDAIDFPAYFGERKIVDVLPADKRRDSRDRATSLLYGKAARRTASRESCRISNTKWKERVARPRGVEPLFSE